ncbi:Linearmycin resistance ATP-binding protein LnrL [Candidatus Brocadiaceae bacterium]|nr:Linearmycin resistance ATP-binding protein LnrL [Candidatus Brocadiaceae bacterium]
MSKEIITVKNFSKSFGTKKVIDDLTFEVFEGEVFAFLGANGSGKTTTIRCLLNILQEDSGELLINNEVYSPTLSSLLGYLPEERGLYLTSRVLETLVYFGQLKGLSKIEATENARNYLQRVDLADKENVDIKKLSSGQQQKIQLGITVINKPKLLILDEPTKGLDPVNRELLLNILLELNKNGSTIVFSTHQMEEVEKIADRLLMIKDGRAVLYGSVAAVKSKYSDNSLYLNFEGKLQEETNLFNAVINKNRAVIRLKDGASKQEVIKYLADSVNVLKLEESTPSLNDIFIQVMNK